jgi:hypothetical protein
MYSRSHVLEHVLIIYSGSHVLEDQVEGGGRRRLNQHIVDDLVRAFIQACFTDSCEFHYESTQFKLYEGIMHCGAGVREHRTEHLMSSLGYIPAGHIPKTST